MPESGDGGGQGESRAINLIGTKCQIGMMKNFVEMVTGDGGTTMGMGLRPLTWTVKKVRE